MLASPKTHCPCGRKKKYLENQYAYVCNCVAVCGECRKVKHLEPSNEIKRQREIEALGNPCKSEREYFTRNNDEKYTESVAHFLTVVGIMWEDAHDEHSSQKEKELSFEKSIQYTLEFIKYRFDPKNVK